MRISDWSSTCALPIFDGNGRVRAVVEQRDASAEERTVRRINTGLIAVDARRLRAWLAAVRNDNVQGEYYLTDIFALATAEGEPALLVPLADAGDCAGANDLWEQIGRASCRERVCQYV